MVVTEEVLRAAAENRQSGKQVIQQLLEQRGPDVVVTEEVVKLVTQSLSVEIIKRLLEKRPEGC